MNRPRQHDVGGTVNTIYFYDQADNYFELSNFYPRSIVIDLRVWPSTEHYYQSQKFAKVLDQEIIRRAHTPAEAFYLGRHLSAERVNHWQAIKVSIMRHALREKFLQHEDLKAILLSTGNAIIKEKSVVDGFWGIGAEGNGHNMMGRLLMELRGSLRTDPSTLIA